MYAFSTPLVPSPSRTFSSTFTQRFVHTTRPSIARAQRVRWTANVQPPTTDTDFDALGKEWIDSGLAKYPVKIIEHAFKSFPGEVAIAFSGAEDVVLIEYASRTKLPYRVFALDTGRLHPETYRFYAEVERHYGIRIEYMFPDGKEVMELVNQKGLFSFYEDGHQECCRIRKVRPLKRKLATLSAWVTGQRKDQSPGTRSEIPFVQVDPAFRGSGDKPLIKYNPLANTSSSDVWATIRATGVPYNALHMEGFTSIGCEPCTRAVLPNQHEREGRWWWEEATQKECGLHKGNISSDAASAESADDFVEESIAKDDVVFFTKRGCPYCKAMKDLFIELGVPHSEYAISHREDYGDIVAALERRTGQTTAPNLFIGGEHIGGNEQTRILHKSGELLTLLEAAGVSMMVQT